MTVQALKNGDRLTRDEFECRYAAMPEIKKAELIEGIVYIGPPVPAVGHGEQHLDLVTLLGIYKVSTPKVRAASGATVRLDPVNEPQPDAAMYIDPACGGQCRFTDGYLTDSPELIGEIASSSVSIDLGIKLHVYRRNGVREYIVWRVRDRAIDWFILRNGQFDRLVPGTDGIYRSEVFPGLWLDVAALLARDLPRANQALQQGLASPEHAAFVTKLRSKND
jgi:Putative restriction endonuclease